MYIIMYIAVSSALPNCLRLVFALLQTTEGDSASGKDSLSTPQQTDSSTNSV